MNTPETADQTSNLSSVPVLFQEIPSQDGKRIGIATLNSPDTLNGLSLSMCRLLDDRLQSWESDPRIVAVVLHGAGDKAFCAGGDLHALYQSMQDSPRDPWTNLHARSFFETEYRLDYRIHRYAKPMVCWASGIVMGGGVGLMLGASHRVVTPSTRFAMPEITIGLFPDVAGTWMLGRLPRGIGEFLALTGAQLGAADCLQYGLADRYCAADGLDALVAALAAQKWPDDASQQAAMLDTVLDSLQLPSPEAGPLLTHADTIRQACNRADFPQVCSAIKAWKHHADPWLARAASTFLSGAPGSARLGFTLVHRARHLSLADVFRMEYIAALHCCAEPDFREGIRALLIDKDKKPRWYPANLEQASVGWVKRFLAHPWPAGQAHPLADL